MVYSSGNVVELSVYFSASKSESPCLSLHCQPFPHPDSNPLQTLRPDALEDPSRACLSGHSRPSASCPWTMIPEGVSLPKNNIDILLLHGRGKS